MLKKEQRHESVREHRGMAPHIPNLDFTRRSASDSRPAPFVPRETAPSNHRMRSCVDPRAALDTVKKRKIY